jgi:hypothetical protein
MGSNYLSCIFILATSSLSAQLVYQSELGVDSVYGQKMLMLENGTLMVASAKGDQIHLSGWNLAGDTLWTRTYPGNANTFGIKVLQRLSNGKILMGGPWGSFRVNEYGEDYMPLPIAGRHMKEIGVDSILSISLTPPSIIRLQNLDGDLFWETSMMVPADHSPQFGGGILVPFDNGFMVLTEYEQNWPPPFWRRSMLSRYALDGSFIDSLTLKVTTGVNQHFLDAIGSQDGGSLIYALNETGCSYLVKTDHYGDTTWTRPWGWGGSVPEFFRVHGATQLANGNYVLSGYSIEPDTDPPVATFHFLELDQNGETICHQPLNEPADLYGSSSDVVVDPNGRLHAVLSDRTVWPWDPLPTFKMIGYDELCFTASINETREDLATINVLGDQLTIQPHMGSLHYEIFDPAGRSVHQGWINSNLSIDLNPLRTGLYLISLSDPVTQDRMVGKVLLMGQ